MGDQRLRPTERLRHSSDFQRVFQQGKKLVTSLFVMYVFCHGQPYSRFGLAVSKRVGKAVARNLVKRRLRGLFRQHKFLLDPPADIVVVVRHGAAQAPGKMFAQQFVSLLHRCQSRKPATDTTEFPACNEESS
jgi:ribonuclease P protein component